MTNDCQNQIYSKFLEILIFSSKAEVGKIIILSSKEI